MADRPYLAFLSYAHRYRNWVEVLHRNLERCVDGRVFFDTKDLGSGLSWVGRLEDGVRQARQLIVVLTPEALASPWMSKERRGFLAVHGPEQRIHVALAVATPKPAFLADLQHVDFCEHDETGYRQGLRELVAGLQGQEDRRQLPELPAGIVVPVPPPALEPDIWRQLTQGLEPTLASKPLRRAAENVFGLEKNRLEGFADAEQAAAATVVLVTGDDDLLAGAARIVGLAVSELEVEELRPLLDRIEELGERGSQPGLLDAWLDKVVHDHQRLVPYFQQRTELDLLDRVYVQLELRAEEMAAGFERKAASRPGRPLTVRELLALEPEEDDCVTRRWVVLGDPGAGKTTLLRYLAATVARQRAWVPVFESLPKLMREREWFLHRIERQMKRTGRTEGLAAVLDREGQEGRLLVLFDGLDEVPRDDRDDAEDLLRQVAARWPRTPIVVTSRPIGYRRLDRDFVELELLPLDGERRREFLARWFGRADCEPDAVRGEAAAEALEADPGLRELAGNPLYLTLMALLIERGSSPERQRSPLYDQVFELLLGGGHRPVGEPMPCQQAVRAVLRHVAYGATVDNHDAEPVAAIEARLLEAEIDKPRRQIERRPRWRYNLRLFLEDLAERTGILGPHDGPEADWSFWHRTFREALASEDLASAFDSEGQEAVLARARKIAGDESRWAEPFALLAGRVDNPDELVKALVAENRLLGLRALASVQGLQDETLAEILELSGDWQERRKVYERVPELVGDPEAALRLLDRLRRGTRDGNDLWFIDRALNAVGERWSDFQRGAEDSRQRLFDHVPKPSEVLFRSVATQQAGRVDLWREIPAGSFLMGSPASEQGRNTDEGPCHEVQVTSDFMAAAMPVTNAQYAAFDPNHEWTRWAGISTEALAHHPVVNVTWYAAMSFCRWLATCFSWLRDARLPTEEEWEYFCRAGSRSCYWSGDQIEDLDRVGWYAGNSKNRTHRVGGKETNPWGLSDVHGNVWEWTLTEWDEAAYSKREGGLSIDPANLDPADLAAAAGGGRVMRGGSVLDVADRARAAYRGPGSPHFGIRSLGFRVVLPAVAAA